MDDDDEGGGPAQGAPGETLYPFGSWICYFCEQINGPALEDCSTFDTDGRVCPGHRGSSRPLTLLPSDPPVDADVAACAINGGPIRSPFARSRQRQCQRPWPGLPGGVSTPTLVGNGTFPSGTSAGNCSSKKGQAVEVVLGVP